MSKQDKSTPAFPVTEAHGCNSGAPGMTLRQYAAIKLRVRARTRAPASGDELLDDMIIKSQHDELRRQHAEIERLNSENALLKENLARNGKLK